MMVLAVDGGRVQEGLKVLVCVARAEGRSDQDACWQVMHSLHWLNYGVDVQCASVGPSCAAPASHLSRLHRTSKLTSIHPSTSNAVHPMQYIQCSTSNAVHPMQYTQCSTSNAVHPMQYIQCSTSLYQPPKHHKHVYTNPSFSNKTHLLTCCCTLLRWCSPLCFRAQCLLAPHTHIAVGSPTGRCCCGCLGSPAPLGVVQEPCIRHHTAGCVWEEWVTEGRTGGGSGTTLLCTQTIPTFLSATQSACRTPSPVCWQAVLAVQSQTFLLYHSPTLNTQFHSQHTSTLNTHSHSLDTHTPGVKPLADCAASCMFSSSSE
jgi:hypothetical protein